MGKNLDTIKGFFGLTVGSVLAGNAMNVVGGISSLSSGVRGATQAAIGGGLLGHATKLFRWK